MNASDRAVLTQVVQEPREADMRPLDLRLFARLFGYTRPIARQRNALFATVIFRAMQLPALAWAVGAVIGGPISRMDRPAMFWGAAGYLLLALATSATMYFRMRFALELGETVVQSLRNELFAKLQAQTMAFYHRTRIGRIISRFTSDTEALRAGVQDVLFVGIVGLGQMIMASVFMIWYDAVLFLIVAAMAPALWGLNRFFRLRLSRAYRRAQDSFSRVTATLAESVNGMRVTQGFVRQDINAGLFHQLVADHSRNNMGAARVAGVFLPLLEFNSQIFIGLVLLGGGYRVLHGYASVEALYQFVLMSGVFFGPLQMLGNQYNQALSAMAGAERVFRLMDEPPDWTDRPDAIPAPRLEGRVEFKDVRFGYEPGKPVLDGIRFAAEPGQTVALVGPTGSGKSSIINLIARFYLADEGVVELDGTDIQRYTDASLHAQMGIVLQQNFLFTGTVFDNIRVGRPNATDAEVEDAARRLGCLEAIRGLPDGFHTLVGEQGTGISLGQRQLICFARALLADPRILLLDEATSSVDTLTEARIQQALATLLKGRTSFVVAHRLSTIRHADQVFVLDQGRIVERGRHAELMGQEGLYAALYHQFLRASGAGEMHR